MAAEPAQPVRPPIPATLLCGFLGSGKTTRINTLIAGGELVDALFLVNDFGRINIDAELIESQDDNIVRLTNGCACCGIAGDFSAQLRDIRQWRPRPAHLVLEASGIARPRPLMQLFDAARGYRLEQAETLIDASAFARHYADAAINDIYAAQIREVAHLRINRIDWLAPTQADRVLQDIKALNPSAGTIVEQTREPPPATPPAPSRKRSSGPLVTESVTWNAPVDITALETLLTAAAPDLIRAKGLVQADDAAGTCHVIQLAGGRLTRVTARARQTLALVVIGYAGDALDTLLASLRRL